MHVLHSQSVPQHFKGVKEYVPSFYVVGLFGTWANARNIDLPFSILDGNIHIVEDQLDELHVTRMIRCMNKQVSFCIRSSPLQPPSSGCLRGSLALRERLSTAPGVPYWGRLANYGLCRPID